MDPKFFRKYADLITESEQAPAVKPQQAAQVLQAKLKPEEQQAMIAMAEKIVGKPLDQLTPQDAQKYGPAFEKALAGGSVMETQLNELNLKAAWATAKNRLDQLGWIAAMAVPAAVSYGQAGGGNPITAVTGSVLLLSLAMMSDTISHIPDEYRAHKELQTATDPAKRAQLTRKTVVR